MKKLNRFLFFLLLIEASLLYIQSTKAFFSDTALSSNNTFTASLEFASPTPTNTPTSTPTITPTPTPENIATHPVISEIQINGANANEDFVELYNPTNTSFDLNGWEIRLKDAAGNDSSLVLIGSSNSIQAHGFFLWASTKSNNYEVEVGADVFNNNTLSENNSLKLEDASNNPVDQVGWGNVVGHYVEGTPYPNSPGSSASIERKAYSSSTALSMESGSDIDKGNGFDIDNNANDFILRSSSLPQNTGSATETQ